MFDHLNISPVYKTLFQELHFTDYFALLYIDHHIDMVIDVENLNSNVILVPKGHQLAFATPTLSFEHD
jgi:hypothetical protein